MNQKQAFPTFFQIAARNPVVKTASKTDANQIFVDHKNKIYA